VLNVLRLSCGLSCRAGLLAGALTPHIIHISGLSAHRSLHWLRQRIVQRLQHHLHLKAARGTIQARRHGIPPFVSSGRVGASSVADSGVSLFFSWKGVELPDRVTPVYEPYDDTYPAHFEIDQSLVWHVSAYWDQPDGSTRWCWHEDD
jgi:hypothetical protein